MYNPIPANIPLTTEYVEAAESAHQQEVAQEAGETIQTQDNLLTERHTGFEEEPITIEERPC